MSNEDGASDAGLNWAELCEVAWQASSVTRRGMHLAARRPCTDPRRAVRAFRPSGNRTDNDCRTSGCLDLFHDLLVAGADGSPD